MDEKRLKTKLELLDLSVFWCDKILENYTTVESIKNLNITIKEIHKN